MHFLFKQAIEQSIPPALQTNVEAIVTTFLASLDPAWHQRLVDDIERSPFLAKQLVTAFLGSEFIVDACSREPKLLFHFLLSDAAFSSLSPLKIIDAVETACTDALAPEAFDVLLRRLRRRFISALYWRDLNNLADFHEVSAAMTAMAEVFIQQAMDYHYRILSEKHGFPVGRESQQVQPMLVLGMGKLGGSELNVSSDIDLIFAFPESGTTQGLNDDTSNKIKSIDNQQFFTQLGQRLIKTLNETTSEGFVFRVDMRLRPYGQSGALASNFVALENYYQSQGRDWERFAAVKARVVACSRFVSDSLANGAVDIEIKAKKELYAILKPFTYRQYIDFSMIESLRQLKSLIAKEVQRKGLQNDIKLGVGGIREIEFIAQSFQLIRGGRDKHLQERNLLLVLDVIKKENYLSTDVVKKLKAAYLFLRKTEHALQAFKDMQTQQLPTDKADRERLAWIVNHSNWEIFYKKLDSYHSHVNAVFQKVIAEPDALDEEKKKEANEWQLFWSNLDADIEVSQVNCIDDMRDITEQLKNFKESRNVNSLSASARARLDEFIPMLLQAVCEEEIKNITHSTAGQTLRRLLVWLESIVTRTSYITLMLENPQTLEHLTRLFAASSWVAQILTQIPSLLDELLSPSTLYTLPEKRILEDELRQRFLRLAPEDTETHMEVLRYFRLAHNLQVAACEITGRLPLMKVSDYLTFTAEVVLEQVFHLAWQTLVIRHGYPPGTSDDSPKFLAVGYGKLGGIEMSYRSDLDLVFIYDNDAQAMTSGNKSIDCQTFYTRLGQKMIHFLNTRTLSGKLYEVDMRLRPSGNSGLLVSSLVAYSRYQMNDAWVWEHQALVRARPVAGDRELAEKYIVLRREVLGQKRDIDNLKAEVISMREKMRENLGISRKKGMGSGEKDGVEQNFHLKQDAGGIVDIEFMVQYAVLAWSHEHRALNEWTDNIRILECLQRLGIVDATQAFRLIDIYQSYRAANHRLALQQVSSSIIEDGQFVEERRYITALWNDWFL